MFVKNCWYCAGWDYELSQGRCALLARRLAGEAVVLYRKLDGTVVAFEDRCCHRQAPLSRGTKEGDSLRCGYHGMKYGPDGVCTEIPGQTIIPPKARVRTYPVVEQDNWIWVWLGDPALADPKHICSAVGPGAQGWNIKTSKVSINTNYRREIENLMDLSHVAWIHRDTLGGSMAWVEAKLNHTPIERGINTEFWMPEAAAPGFAKHLFPPEAVFDAHANINFTLPCNFIMRYQVWSPGTMKVGKENGLLLLDSWSSQAVTPRDEHWCDYYYSWGLSEATDSPGMVDLLVEAANAAFLEDKAMLEAQYERLRECPDGNKIDIKADTGPNKMLFLVDKLLAEEAAVTAPRQQSARG
ncbi:MAG: aromatic ring-hydroxylating dioxygenase subunit alpha [Gammaproteobacteria bacterium]|nr:aromatic ring-hydroxylating dioxygenase subunit alpha [Gammaproteobacteria bacterium]